MVFLVILCQMLEYHVWTLGVLLIHQTIIQSILISGRLGPNVQIPGCFGLRLKHLKSEELHWLHPDLTVGEVEQRYESHHAEAEWRWGRMTVYITNILPIIWTFHKCAYVFYFRYDLRIRYIPTDFMKRLKNDRTFLLYFYQQVSKHLQICFLSVVVCGYVLLVSSCKYCSSSGRCVVTTCSIMLAKLATAWHFSWAVWRSGNKMHSLFAFIDIVWLLYNLHYSRYKILLNCEVISEHCITWFVLSFRRFYKDMNAKGLEKRSNFDLLE